MERYGSQQFGFDALQDDETRRANRYHRYAALADNDSVRMYPALSTIPYADTGGGAEPLEVTPTAPAPCARPTARRSSLSRTASSSG
ncbi:MAG: hypothetical protein AAF211_09255, partial [Myxococcota bacterium]